MKDWLPIAFCNVLYKIISKVLANRLKGVLSQCIFDNQSTFVSGKSILDNAMVAIEVIHFMKTKTRVDDMYVCPKLDISKAYDHLNWDICVVLWSKWVLMLGGEKCYYRYKFFSYGASYFSSFVCR